MRLPDRLYHLAEVANWPSIQRLGLLSTARLLELAGLAPAERERRESQQRTQHTILPGGFEIRDQKPMPPSALQRCLVGLQPQDWYRLINRRVFFWLDAERLNRQRGALDPRAQVVLVLSTQRLLHCHAQRVSLTPINSGNARRKAALRGLGSFVPYARWQESAWDFEAQELGISARSRSHPPAELTIEDAVPDILECLLDVHTLGTGEAYVP